MNILLSVQAIALALYALPILFVPSTFWSLYGVTLSDGTTVLAQLFGGVAFGNAVLSWFARNAGHSELRQAMLLAFFIHWTVGFIVTLKGQIAGAMNPFGWTLVAWCLIFGLFFGYFRFIGQSTGQAKKPQS
jgi:hypothetical protein